MTPEQIAKGLTKAQWAALFALDGRARFASEVGVSHVSLTHILAKGLCLRTVPSPKSGVPMAYQTTPLGLAVRAILEKQDDQ